MSPVRPLGRPWFSKRKADKGLILHRAVGHVTYDDPEYVGHYGPSDRDMWFDADDMISAIVVAKLGSALFGRQLIILSDSATDTHTLVYDTSAVGGFVQ